VLGGTGSVAAVGGVVVAGMVVAIVVDGMVVDGGVAVVDGGGAFVGSTESATSTTGGTVGVACSVDLSAVVATASASRSDDAPGDPAVVAATFGSSDPLVEHATIAAAQMIDSVADRIALTLEPCDVQAVDDPLSPRVRTRRCGPVPAVMGPSRRRQTWR
jgi:hypothetical protein